MAEKGGRTGSDDWAPRGVLRGLLWWPPVSFLLAVAVPDSDLFWIVVAGLVLAGAGGVTSLVGYHQRRRTAHPEVRPGPDLMQEPVAELASHTRHKAA